MKKLRGPFALLLALLLAVGCATTAFAGEWTVGTSAELENAFAADTDATVTITMTGDITLLNSLEAKEGQIYIINGQAYVLKDVVLYGGGSVTINADIASDANGDSFQVREDVTAVVNGDISADEDAVNAYDNAVVTVTGDVTAESDGVYADDSANVTVTGNITAVADEGVDAQGAAAVTVNGNISAGGNGIEVDNNASATVTGNVTAEGDGINADDATVVTVTGEVTAGDDGIDADDEAVVTVTGDVTGVGAGSGGVYAEGNSVVTVNGNVTGGSGELTDADMQDPKEYSDGGNGVNASDNAAVTVTGNATGGDAMGTYGYAGDGVVARDTATVTVGGTAQGGSVTADPAVEAYEYSDGSFSSSIAGDGVAMESTASVTVGGDAIGGDTNGDRGEAGHGIALITLAPVEGDISQGNNNDEQAAVPEAGQAIVKGTAMGGKALNSTALSGKALYYVGWAEYYGLSYQFGTTEQEILNTDYADSTDLEQLAQNFSMLMTMYDRFGGSSGMDALELEVEKAYLESLGITVPADFDPNAPESEELYAQAEAAQANMTENESMAWELRFLQVRVNLVQERVKAMLIPDETQIADVTVWALSAENGGMVDASFGAEAVAVLCAENTEYIIRVQQPEHGTITVDKETALAGETVTVTVTPDEGYQVDSVSNGYGKLTVNEDGSYSFQVPAGGAITVSAEISQKTVVTPSTPATGDSTNTGVWAAAAALSVAAMVTGVLFLRKKTRQDG